MHLRKFLRHFGGTWTAPLRALGLFDRSERRLKLSVCNARNVLSSVACKIYVIGSVAVVCGSLRDTRNSHVSEKYIITTVRFILHPGQANFLGPSPVHTTISNEVF